MSHKKRSADPKNASSNDESESGLLLKDFYLGYESLVIYFLGFSRVVTLISLLAVLK